MATMSHNKAQRKAWHAGKRRKAETKKSWFRRVIAKGNHNGGYTPPRFRLYYQPRT